MKKTIISVCAAMLLVAVGSAVAFDDDHQSIIGSLPPSPSLSVTTVPADGDVNPYGVAFVPQGFPKSGMLSPGDVLVSNFNNSSNSQGTGSTIVRVTPGGTASTFFQGSNVPLGTLGLTTALGVLQRGFVLVGNVPTTDGTCASISQGSLLVIDRNGSQVANLADSHLLDGPWYLTIHDQGEQAQVFVSDVLSGTVTRLDVHINQHSGLTVKSATQIASGYSHRCDPAALVVGPTGLAYDADEDILYVASTGDNEVFAISGAGRTHRDSGTGKVIYKDDTHLHGPLALLLAPNGHLLTANGDAVNPDPTQPSEIVEFTKSGRFVAQFSVDSSGLGGAFGIALAGSDEEFRFAAVDDINNSLDVWIVR
jgi:hypothetical protein